MNKKYITEREGQIDFFNKFNINYKEKEVLIDNTDGVWNGNILEFKLNINNPNKVLFQAIKYLSKMRIKGESVPTNIILVSLNTTIAYLYHSEDYFNDIHKQYIGASSKNNDNFIAKDFLEKIDYSNQIGAFRLINLLKENNYMKIDLDENCICGWAERYYKENPKANKGDFLGDETGEVRIKGEIREPKVFKDFINPYTKPTNEKFKYLMDKLNDKLKQKDLGAFYTPIPYCEKARELIEEAIKKVPEGNDYIILDRCSGTGNLESVLTDEELSHCILSTYEYYEYKVLVERLGDKVRSIIPPIEMEDTYDRGFVRCANALSKEYLENEIIKTYLDNPKCSVIMLENPPYMEAGALSTVQERNDKGTDTSSSWKNDYVIQEMKKEVKGVASNDLANCFIWSAFKYYLRQETDSYIVFSPIKYWKSAKLVNKKFEKGFIFNRKYFHAGASAISCILWSNKPEEKEELTLEVYDIKDNELEYIKTINSKKVNNLPSALYDKREIKNATEGILCNTTGEEVLPSRFKVRVKPYHSNDILGYMIVQSFGITQKGLSSNITQGILYNGNGFYLRKDNYLKKLPLYVAKQYPLDNWYDKDFIYSTTDKGELYTKDKDLEKASLIYTVLTQTNHMLSFVGSDNRFYRNELCFDNDTIASRDVLKYELNNDDKELLNLYKNILNKARETANYNKDYTYGTYQIIQDLNTFVKDDKNKKVYDYPELNGLIEVLKTKLKEYYKKYISDKLFEYELLK